MLDKQLQEEIREFVQSIILPTVITTVKETTREAIREVLAPSSETSKRVPFIFSTLNQRKVFADIQSISGTNRKVRSRIESLLNQLEGEPVDEALAIAVKRLLVDRNWWVRCPCGEPARFLWQKNRRCKNNGILVFSHLTDDKRCLHSSTTRFPRVRLVTKR